MKIQSAYAKLEGNETVYDLPSIEILGRDGRPLFCITETEDGTGVEVSASSVIKSKNGTLFSEQVAVKPRASNVVTVFRLPH